MLRRIVSFSLDSESDWMAHLACGHGQHTRHNPPLNERAWVLTEAGRAAKVGSELACVRCDRSELPDGFAPYKRTPTFTEATVPRGLLETHSTKEGVWGLIHVVEGELEYVKHAPFDTRDVVTPSATAVVIAAHEHHVACASPVEFFVEFWRAEMPARD